jgi:nucleotide-binding universal stress UspA family protein
VREILFYGVEPPPVWKETLAKASIASREIPPEGEGAVSVLQAAEREQVSILVLLAGDGGEGGDTYPGTVMKDLIRDASLPTLVVRETGGDNGKGGLFSHVIFGTNWTDPAGRALEFLFDFREFIVEMEVVHVINEKLTVRDMRELKAKLTETRKKCLDRGIDAEAHYYAGDTAEEIVTSSRDYRGSLIAIGGSTEKPFLRRLFEEEPVLGVVKRSRVPVLIVP